MALREQNRRKGYFLNFRKPLFGDPTLSLRPVSLSNLILLDNKSFLGRKAMTNLDGILKRREITLSTKVHLVKAMVFPVVMHWWELDHKEGWVPKDWCFCTMVLEKTLESSLDCKEINPVNPKGNQPWIFIGRTVAEAPTILWPPDVKSRLTRKDPDAGKYWRQKEKRAAENEIR